MKKNIAKSLALALALVTTTNNTTFAEDINIEVVGGGHIETISNKTIEIHPEGDCHYIESYDTSSKKMKIVITEECKGDRRFDIPFKEISYIEFQAPYTFPTGHTYMYLDLTNAQIGTYRFPIMAHNSWQYLDLSWNYKNSTGKRVSTRTNREENVWEISITQAYYDVTLKDGLNNNITSTIKTSQSLPNGSGVSGYTFDGWYRNSSHTGEKVTSMSQITGNTTLYAKYVPNKYNLILNIDGKVEKQSVTYNSSFNINSPTKTGYTFNGWYTNSNLTNRYNKPSKYNVVGDTTLYAKFIPNDYQITFNNIYGLPLEYQSEEYLSGIENSKTVTYDSSFELPTPTHIGYNFNGWYTDTSFQNRFSPEKYNIADNITLYPKWTPKKFNLTFNLNGGISNGGTDLGEVSFYDKIPVPQEPTAPRGYKALEHWLLIPDDEESIEWDFETRYTYLKNSTLKAIYIPNIYKIIYYIGSEIEEQEVTFNSDYTLKIPTKTGYTFNGWYVDEDFQEEYVKTETYNEDKNINLYAKFIPNKYNINYTLNGGKFEDEEIIQEVTFDSNFTLKIPTKTGYTFNGWYVDESLETEYVKPEKYDVVDDLQLYAKFTPNEYSIIIKSGVDNSTLDTIVVTYDNEYLLPNIEIPNYKFTGYSYGGEKFESTDIYTFNKDIEIVANFEKIEEVKPPANNVNDNNSNNNNNSGNGGSNNQNSSNDNNNSNNDSFINNDNSVTLPNELINKDDNKDEKDEKPNNNYFEDISNHWAKDTINDLAKKGIINGFNGKFLPDKNITREEAVLVIDRAISILDLDLENKEPIMFYDKNEISSWVVDSFNRLNEKGLVYGYGNNYFKPDRNITREEVICLLDRLILNLDLYLEDTEITTFKDSDSISWWAVESFNNLVNKGIINGYNLGYLYPKNNVTRAEFVTLINNIISKF